MARQWSPLGWMPRLRTTLVWGAAIGVLSLLGGLLFAWSGVYNVAASSEHLAITRALLTFGLHSSVRTHSIGIEPPIELDDEELVRLGARHFEGGCATCHGAPGKPRNPIVEEMLPPPPGLSHLVPEWKTRELFWIVRHGLKYTAMPAWPALQRDDEVWAVTAFLRRLPDLSSQDYRALAGTDASSEDPPGFATFAALGECARCHGDEDSPPTSRLVPTLHGQSAAYLKSALRAYADGSRFSGMMQPAAAALDAESIERIGEYYAALSREGGRRGHVVTTPRDIEIGRRIAVSGIPEQGVPPCLACHGEHANAIFPRLRGQHAPYVLNQLKLFKEAKRGATAASAIMETIARRLDVAEMSSVAAYFEGLGGAGAVSDVQANASREKAAP